LPFSRPATVAICAGWGGTPARVLRSGPVRKIAAQIPSVRSPEDQGGADGGVARALPDTFSA